MVINTELCVYTEYRVYPGRGQRYIARDGKISFFINSKAESLFHQRIKPVKLRWTQAWRRMNKKGKVDDQAKKRTRKAAKFQKAIVGMSLDDIKKKKAQKPELRQAAKEAAAKEAKARTAAREAAAVRAVGAAWSSHLEDLEAVAQKARASAASWESAAKAQQANLVGSTSLAIVGEGRVARATVMAHEVEGASARLTASVAAMRKKLDVPNAAAPPTASTRTRCKRPDRKSVV